jgi:hypothetical protein
MVRSVRLYNDCSSSDVRVDAEGRVLADDNKSEKFRKSVCLHACLVSENTAADCY